MLIFRAIVGTHFQWLLFKSGWTYMYTMQFKTLFLVHNSCVGVAPTYMYLFALWSPLYLQLASLRASSYGLVVILSKRLLSATSKIFAYYWPFGFELSATVPTPRITSSRFPGGSGDAALGLSYSPAQPLTPAVESSADLSCSLQVFGYIT